MGRRSEVCKILLHRVIKEQILTFEELTTAFHQVDALLNSRTLSGMSPDPNEYQSLIAGHFLTSEYLVNVSKPFILNVKPKFSLHLRWVHV